MAKTGRCKDKDEKRRDEFPLLAYLDDLVDDLRDHVPEALKVFDADGIHDARVSTRRLKAGLDLLEPVLSKDSTKPFAKVLKKLRRRLGPMRDQDVMIEHLGELKANASQKRAAEWLGEKIATERRCEREHAGAKSAPASVLAKLGAWWGVREEVSEAHEAIDSLLASSLHLQLDAFIEQADLLCRERNTAEAPADYSDAGPQNPHELRIAGKALRYTLEMARENGHALPGDVARSFKKMQESLGTWHDFVVLTEKAMTLSTDAMLAHHDAELQQRILELARSTMQRASRELNKFGQLWNQKGEGLAHTIRLAFPLSRSLQEEEQQQQVNESQTDRGQKRSAETPAPAAPLQGGPSAA